jgi:hypothetical protein
VVQAEVAGDEVHAPVAIEVARGDARPPSSRRWQPRRCRHVAQAAAVVAIEADRHPLSDGHQVQPSIAVEIDPGGVGDHPAGADELRRELLGHVREPAAVIPQQVASRGERIPAG